MIPSRNSALRSFVDDALLVAALVAIAALCLWFRYLPMVDLPQHYAMVSILVHHDEPAYGFAQRYTFDFVHRPYATVYWLGAAFAHVMPLGAAMRIVVALCTLAPLAGAQALLAATDRPRFWLLLAVPFAFGSLWHWGFLNFLLGTGLFLAGLALAVRSSRRPGARWPAALAVLSLVLFFTHFHGLVMLLLTAPLFAWAFRGNEPTRPALVRAVVPLAPAGLSAVAFVLITWRQAEGAWDQINPGWLERMVRFPEFLATGLPAPWPSLWLVGVAALGGIGYALAGADRNLSRRALAAFCLALLAQGSMYLLLPLNTNTATYVSARHALLCVLFVVPLLPSAEGRTRAILRVGCGLFAGASLLAIGLHLRCFDREARDFEGVLAVAKPNRRMAPLIFDPGSPCVHAATFPYLHFAGYYQAARGGELARSFAVVWNVPIRYRDDYRRYPIREEIEWAPRLFSTEDVRHFDYVLVRGGPRFRLAHDLGILETAKSGAWSLFENPKALPAELPDP